MTETTTLDQAVATAEKAPKSFAREILDSQDKITEHLNSLVEKGKEVIKEEGYQRKPRKEASCRTDNIRASLVLPGAHEKGRFCVSTGDGTASIHFNGRAAKSLYFMLKQVFE